MLLYSYENKFNTLIQKQNVNTLKKFDTQELDLLYKSKKVSILYSLFLYYLRIIYKLLINIYFLKSKKYRDSKNRMINFILKHYKKTKNKYLFSKDIILSMVSYFTNMYQSKIIMLSIFLEKNGTFIMIRNLNKLTKLVRTQISKITTLKTNQLFKLSSTIKKYLWHYNKLILDRIEEKKFSFYIKLITIYTNFKYNQIYSYLSNEYMNKTIDFTNWFSVILEYYINRTKATLSAYQNKFADQLALHSFGIIKLLNIKKQIVNTNINIRVNSSYIHFSTK